MAVIRAPKVMFVLFLMEDCSDWLICLSHLLNALTHVYVCVFSSPCSPLALRCSQGQAVQQSGSGGSHGGIAQASLPLKFHLEEISSIITGGRTSSPNAGGENLELSIVFPASSLRLYNNLSVRCSRLFILFTLWLLLLNLYRLEAHDKKNWKTQKLLCWKYW